MNGLDLTPEQLEELLALASVWAEQQQERILATGIGLSAVQVSDARQMGVLHPERVRWLAVPSIPVPEHPVLRAAGEALGLVSPSTVGLALGYGVYLRSDSAGDRYLLAHELVHTAQYERCGSIEAFLRQYLHECLTIGYPAAPLEQEALLRSERLRRAAAEPTVRRHWAFAQAWLHAELKVQLATAPSSPTSSMPPRNSIGPISPGGVDFGGI
jgi:hypothetical protein